MDETKNENNNTPAPVPFAVFECAMANQQQDKKRLFFALILAIILLFASNAGWLWAWLQYDYVSDTITVESTATGHANYIGNSGSIYNGESDGQETQENPEE